MTNQIVPQLKYNYTKKFIEMLQKNDHLLKTV